MKVNAEKILSLKFTFIFTVFLLGFLTANSVDVTIGYNTFDVTSRNDRMAELCYHEFTHAAYYNKVGNNLYGDFVQAEINELISNFGNQFSPYGPGNTGNSPIIALGESWAYHMGIGLQIESMECLIYKHLNRISFIEMALYKT